MWCNMAKSSSFALFLYHVHNTGYSVICICRALASLCSAAWLSQTSLCCYANTLMVAKNRSTFVSLVRLLTFAIFFVLFLFWQKFRLFQFSFLGAANEEDRACWRKTRNQWTSNGEGEQFGAKFGNKLGKANGSEHAEGPTLGFPPARSICTGEWCGAKLFWKNFLF